MIRINRTLLAGTVALVTAAFAPSAYAIPQLQISDGSTTITVTDQSLGDNDANPGSIVFFGSIGAFTINVTTGITKPVLGSATQPILDLNSINVTGTGAATLTITFSETDFLSTGSGVNFITSVGGVSDSAGSVSFDYFASATNSLFATDMTINTTGALTGPFAYSSLGSAALTGLYSLTTIATIVHTGAGQNSSFNSEFESVTPVIEIPEAPFAPSLLIGTLLLAGRAVSRRRARRA